MLVFRRPLVAIILLVVASGPWSETDGGLLSAPPDTEQIERSLMHALEAAEQGRTEDSLTAVRQALAVGIPATADSLLMAPVGDLNVRQSHAASVRRIHRLLVRLVESLQRSAVDSAELSETLQAIVLPDALPRAVFRYAIEQDPVSTESDWLDVSVGQLWVQTAIRAGKQVECLQFLERRRVFRESARDADILILQLGLEQRDSGLVERALQGQLQGPSGPIDAAQIMALVELSQRVPDILGESLRRLADEVLLRWMLAGRNVSLSESQRTHLRAMAVGEARDAFSAGTGDETGLKWLAVADWFAEPAQGSARDATVIRRLLQHQEQVAWLLLSSGRTELATERLRLLSALQLEFSVAGPSALVGRHCDLLRALPGEDRYEFLRAQLLREQSIPLAAAGFQWPGAGVAGGGRGTSGGATADASEMQLPGESLGLPLHPVLMLLDAAMETGQGETLLQTLSDLAAQGHVPAMAAQVCLLMALHRHDQATVQIQEFFALPREGVSSGPEAEALLLYRMLLTTEHRAEALRQLFSRDRSGLSSTSGANSAALALALSCGPLDMSGSIGEQRQGDVSTLQWLADAAAGLDPVVVPQVGRVSGGLVTRMGGGRGTLCFPWPLSGDFELSCTAVALSGPLGGLGFDGVSVSGMARADMLRVEAWGNHGPSLRQGAPLIPAAPVRLSVSARGDTVELLVNGAVIQRWPRTGLTVPVPFVFLEMGGAGCTQWSDFRLSGLVQIPREVRLSETADLRGWSSRRLQQSQPGCDVELSSGHGAATPSSTVTPRGRSGRTGTDWWWESGTVLGRRRGRVAEGTQRPGASSANLDLGLLQYVRPLQNGDALQWEFEYQPNEVESGIAMGSLIFWLRPGGVSVDTIPDNGVSAGLVSRMPQPTAAVDEQTACVQPGWNSGRLELRDGQAILNVNGRELLRHSIPPGFDTRPGIVHDRARAEARVRALLLKGEWPETLAESDLQELFSDRARQVVGSPPDATLAERTVNPAEELAVSRTAGETAGRLAVLDAATAIEEGLAWVFPADGAVVRWYGAPGSGPRDRSRGSEGQQTFQLPEIVVSPMLELVSAAAALNRLAELETRFQSAGDAIGDEEANREFLQTLLAIVQDKAEAAVRLRALADQIEARQGPMNISPWAVLTVAQAAAGRGPLRADAIRLLRGVLSVPAGLEFGTSGIEDCRRSLLSLLDVLSRSGDQTVSGAALPPLRDWVPLRFSTAVEASQLPPSVWIQPPGSTVQLVCGTEADGVCWPVPLADDFTVSCTVTPVAGRYPIPGYGGVWFADAGPGETESTLGIKEIPWSRTAIFPEMSALSSEPAKPRHYRLQMRQRQLTLEIDGKQVFSRPFAERAAPWLVFRSPPEPGAQIRLDELTIPTPGVSEVRLDTGRELSGWREPWFPRTTTMVSPPENSETWRSSEAKLIGVRQSLGGGLPRASLLQYLRPLPKRGTLSYAFFYEPDHRMVHPVIGRQLLITEPQSGLREVPLKASKIDLTASVPVGVEGALSLRSNDWNQMQLNVSEDRVDVVLNGQVLGTITLERTSDRVFGLFHWGDQTAAEVRDLIMSGEWSAP